MTPKEMQDAADALKQAYDDFRASDADGDHRLSATEYPAVVQNGTAFGDVDTDGDGYVDPFEFMQALNKYGQRP